MNERDTIGGSENLEAWGESPLVKLQNRVLKLEEDLATAAEVIQNLIRRLERLEERPAFDPEDSDLDDLEDEDGTDAFDEEDSDLDDEVGGG